MHARVTRLGTPTPIFLSCIYASYKDVDQARLWESLSRVGQSVANDPRILSVMSIYVAIARRREMVTPHSLLGYVDLIGFCLLFRFKI